MEAKLKYLRPIKLSILLSVTGELYLLIYYGLIQYPEGSIVLKFLWTVVFCGLGMGSTLGAFVNLLLVDKLAGYKAILATMLLSFLVLGVACNLLCLNLDQHFHFFGGHENPRNFLVSGIILAPVGGLILGLALFTRQGQQAVTKFGL